jgi:fumarate hydratase class II
VVRETFTSALRPLSMVTSRLWQTSSFVEHWVAGIAPDTARIADLGEKSLMTALVLSIGYDKAAAIAEAAHANGTTLQEAARLVSAEEFDHPVQPDAHSVQPDAMTHPS